MKPVRLKPVPRQSAESLVTEHLRTFVLSGALQPGERLTEIALATQLGVARATLRTGLHRLASEGILVQIPYTGWQVAALSAHDVWELWTLRGSLESLAARLSAQAEADAHDRISKAYQTLVAECEKGSMSRIANADFALHRTIIESVGNSRLERQYRLVEQQVRLFIATSNSLVSDGPQAIVAQHQPIVEALMNRDGNGAANAAWHHNESEGKRLASWIEEREMSSLSGVKPTRSRHES